MCGITGYFGNRPIETETIRAAVATLVHRGPEKLAAWQNADHTVALGHSRLSIIDLVTGDQPISSRNGDLHLVANGEFYDFERIRTELEADGAVFKTKSDSEIALHLYERKGTRALSELRGEFAFAIWDQKNQQLFAARDRFGIKPLFYAQRDGNLFFGSEIKSLLRMGVEPKWDLETVFALNSSWAMAPTRTPFRGIYQVPAGHYLLATKGEVRILPYWDFNYPVQPTITDEQEAIALVREKLEEAVRLRLRADVPVGVYLSGGLDSCSVLGFAAKQLSAPLHTFTIQFGDPDYDESAIGRRMASYANAQFNPVVVTEQEIADHFAEAVWHAETMFINTHGIAKFLLSRRVHQAGIKVVLTGEGSDEIFGGYPHFRQDLIRYSLKNQTPEEARALMAQLEEANRVSAGTLLSSGEDSPAIHEVRRLLGFSPSFFEVNVQAGQKTTGFLSDDFLAPFGDRNPSINLLRQFDGARQLFGRDPVHQSMYLWSKTTLQNYILSVLGDRMEMANSVEARLPFLDHHLVEAVVQMPSSLKIKGLTEKFVLREAAKEVITEEIYKRQKHPFLAPPPSLKLNGPIYELFQQELRGSGLQYTPFYDGKKILALLDRLPEMDPVSRMKYDPVLTIAMSLTFMGRRFGISV